MLKKLALIVALLIAPSIADAQQLKLLLGRAPTAPPPVGTSIRFGDSTPVGFGGAAISGTSVSGTFAADFQVVAGQPNLLVKASTSANTDCSPTPCSLTTNTGQALTVGIDANAYDVATPAEWSGTAANSYGAVAGTTGTTGLAKRATQATVAAYSAKTIFLRSGVQIPSSTLATGSGVFFQMDFGDGTPLTVTSRDLALIQSKAYVRATPASWPVDGNGDLGFGAGIGSLVINGTGGATPSSQIAGFTDTILINYSNIIFRGLCACGPAQDVTTGGSLNIDLHPKTTAPIHNITLDWVIMPGYTGGPGNGLVSFGTNLAEQTNRFPNGLQGDTHTNIPPSDPSQWLNASLGGPGTGLSSSNNAYSNVTLSNSVCYLRVRCVNMTWTTGTLIEQNLMDGFWDEAIQLNYGGFDANPTVVDNLMTREWARGSNTLAYYFDAPPCGVTATCTATGNPYHTDAIFIIGGCLSASGCIMNSTGSFSGTTLNIDGPCSPGPALAKFYVIAAGVPAGVTATTVPAGGCAGAYTLSANVGTIADEPVQLNAMQSNISPIVDRNVFVMGNAPGGQARIIAIGGLENTPNSFPKTDSTFSSNLHAVGNLIVGNDGGNSIDIQFPAGGTLEANTVIGRNMPADAQPVAILMGFNDNSGRACRPGTTMTVGANVVEQAMSFSPNCTITRPSGVPDNVTLGQAGATIPYATAFAGVSTGAGVPVNFTGSISDVGGVPTLTVTAIANTNQPNGHSFNYGYLSVGATVTCGGCTAGTKVTAFGTGSGAAGTYTVNNSQTVASGAMVAAGVFNPVSLADALTAIAVKSGGPLDHTAIGSTYDVGALGNGVTLPTQWPGGTGTTNLPTS